MNDNPKRGSWTKLVFVVACLCLLYALSFGPVIAMQKRRWTPVWEHAVTSVVYEPLHWAIDCSPTLLRQKFLDYMRWWAP